MPKASTQALLTPLVHDNPIVLQILGICSALAVTKTLATALTMSIAVTVVLTLSNATISLIRQHMPRSIRLIVQITIIASLVIVVDHILKAYAYEMSKRLSVFVGLIVTNCIIVSRAETYATKHRVGVSALDGLGNGLGYSTILVLVGTFRELLGAGTLLGVQVFPLVSQGGWFYPVALMLLPPSAFFLIGLLIWGLKSWQTEHVEQHEFQMQPVQESGGLR